jgi:transposase
MSDTIIGVDLAKRVFQVHGATMTGHVMFRKKLSREQFRIFMAAQPACVIVFEACGSASYWAREMEALGHEARLIAPQYVRPFVKRQKNDATDAEAIVTAARQPEMRFVTPKTQEQQAKAVLFRGRERLVHQRTELVNALRAVLYECGHVFPIGLSHLKRIDALVKDPACDLPALIIAECQDLLLQIAAKTERIDVKTKTLKALAAKADTSRHLQTMPGVGPRGLCARHGAVQVWSRLRSLAGARAASAFFWRQGAPREDIESGSGRYPAAFDHRGDD